MTPKSSKAAEEFAALVMGSIDEEAFLLGPGAVQQAIVDFIQAGRTERELVSNPHPHAEESDPRKIAYIFTVRRDETADEKAAREKLAEQRLNVALWTMHHEGPPPRGTGFTNLSEQKIWWAPKEGDPVKIADMELSHRRNLLAYLERNAEALKLQADWAMYSTFPDSPSDGVADALDGIMDEMDHTTADDWIHARPLVKALRKSIKKDERTAAAR